MKKPDFRQEKARSAFKSLYPYLIRRFDFTDKEIDFFINHSVFNYRLYVCNCLCEVYYSFPSLFKGNTDHILFDFCYNLLEGNFLPF